MKIGYARVSTDEQLLDLQVNALQNFGCNRIFTDKLSGTKEDRDGLQDAINYCRDGDIFVVWKLDRLSRSLKHLINVVEDLGYRNVQFVALDNQIDTTQSTGKLLFHLVASFAEFERSLISDRTKAGLGAARDRGSTLGRPSKINDKIIQKSKELVDQKLSITEVCKILEISRATFYQKINPILLGC